MLIKSALRIHLSVSYGMISILKVGSLRSPPPIRLRRTFHLKVKRFTMICASLALLQIMFAVHPRESVSHDSQVALLPYESCSLATPSGDRINRSMLSCRDMAPWLSIHSPTTKWGEGGGASHQRGSISSPAGRLYGFPTGESPVVKVLYKTGAFYNLKAPYLASGHGQPTNR